MFIATEAACVDVKQDTWPASKTSQVYIGKNERKGTCTTNTVMAAIVSENVTNKFSYSNLQFVEVGLANSVVLGC